MWRPILVYSAVFIALFVSHIMAAANDLQLIFQVIATLISIQTLFAGLILHLLGGDVRHARFPIVALRPVWDGHMRVWSLVGVYYCGWFLLS